MARLQTHMEEWLADKKLEADLVICREGELGIFMDRQPSEPLYVGGSAEADAIHWALR